MKYMSSKAPFAKDIPAETLTQVRDYLDGKFPGGLQPTNTFGEIQDALLEFRTKDGNRLLLNQLAPIFLALCWGEQLI